MASMKLGLKANGFRRQDQDCFCMIGLPSDARVEVGETSFHLHKFPLLSKSSLLEKLIREKSNDEEEDCVIQLSDVPGGAEAFENIAKFCYGTKLELTASNVVYIRCAAEHLEMTEEIAEGNLITQTEIFLDQVVLRSWKDSITALQTCDHVLPHAEHLQIVKRCVDSLSLKACKDPNVVQWSIVEGYPMQSPSGSILWNGISTGARTKNSRYDWWYEDVSSLSLPLYKKLISVMEARGIRQEIISGSIAFYAKRHLPGLSRQQSITEPRAIASPPSEEEQKRLVEDIDSLLPPQKGLVSTEFLFGFLHIAMILQASRSCVSNLERRIGMQLDQASLKDLLIPNFSNSTETFYDVDCIRRIVDHFFASNQMTGEASSVLPDDEHVCMGSPLSTTIVAKLVDGYLAEVASDVNLKQSMFRSLAAAIPEDARQLDDGLYHAIDIYLKAHPWLTESEREEICMLMDCQKLSLEACIHSAKNKNLPLRVVIQVVFFEQLQLRSLIGECFHECDNLEGGGWSSAIREIEFLKVRMEGIRMKMCELEKGFLGLREALTTERSHWTTLWTNLWSNIKSQMCSTHEDAIH